jgi:hypothetical protein
MGERLNGIQEVGSSILPGSTNRFKSRPQGRLFGFRRKLLKMLGNWRLARVFLSSSFRLYVS